MEDLNNATIIHETESFSRDHPLTNQVLQPNNNNTAPVAMAVDATGAGSVSEQVGVKRGKGRPKKNDSNGRSMVLLTPPPPSSGVSAQPLVGETNTIGKRGRGRPRGTGKLQIVSAIG
ncbi:hypothetical protein RIF29_33340 [Crotalaria pallida]|uniref:AT-hook motif nuclear-localized protein n=1 Tax=Crotalaria pallida TaxID=3830 RepID=A0AAN9E880_CROPI